MSDRERHEPGELEPDKIPQKLVPIQDVPDETSGTLLAEFLRGEGIQAALQPVEISMLPGVESASHGYWGRVEVLERDVPRARTLIREFMAQKPDRAGFAAGPGDDDPEDPA